MADRTLTYFVSDVHLGLRVEDPAEREARFVSFLNSIPSDRTEALYLLGDIWDFWYEYRDVVPKGYVRVFAALMDLMDAGVKVYFFQGNHDIWCYHYFQDMGIQILEQPHVVRIGGKTFCLGHGDGLGPGFKGYKAMRWLFHNRIVQGLFSMLHPTIAFRMGTGWSTKSRVSKAREYVFRGVEEPLFKFAMEFSKTQKVDYFIFGHYHASEDMPLPNGARLVVMKDWIKPQSSNWVLYDGMTGCLGISQKIEK